MADCLPGAYDFSLGVATAEGKTEAIKKWPIPQNVMEV